MSIKHKKFKQYKNTLQVWQPYSCIVAERVEVDEDDCEYLVKGSTIFCGACGHSLGKLNSDLTFPFSYNSLKSRMLNIGFRGKEFLQCKKCGHTLFEDVLKMVVTKIGNFLELQKEAISEAVVKDLKSGKLKEAKVNEQKPKNKLRVQK